MYLEQEKLGTLKNQRKPPEYFQNEPIIMTYLSHLRLPRGPGTHLALALAHVVHALGPLFLA